MFKNFFKANKPQFQPSVSNAFRIKVKEQVLEKVSVVVVNDEDAELHLLVTLPENDPFANAVKSKFYKGVRVSVEATRPNGAYLAHTLYEVTDVEYGMLSFMSTSSDNRKVEIHLGVKKVGSGGSGNVTHI